MGVNFRSISVSIVQFYWPACIACGRLVRADHSHRRTMVFVTDISDIFRILMF